MDRIWETLNALTGGTFITRLFQGKTNSANFEVTDNVTGQVKVKCLMIFMFNPRPGGGLSHLRHGGGGGSK